MITSLLSCTGSLSLFEWILIIYKTWFIPSIFVWYLNPINSNASYTIIIIIYVLLLLLYYNYYNYYIRKLLFT